MREPIDAIYEDGILRPLVPLALPDKARVKLLIDASTETPTIVRQDEIVPQDEWERRLLEVAKDCGVSLADTAVSSEGLYD